MKKVTIDGVDYMPASEAATPPRFMPNDVVYVKLRDLTVAKATVKHAMIMYGRCSSEVISYKYIVTHKLPTGCTADVELWCEYVLATPEEAFR